MTQLELAVRDSVMLKLEDDNPTYLAWARNVARTIAIRKGVVCADDLRDAADRVGIHRDNWNVNGRVFLTREWFEVGRVTSRTKGSHGRKINVYRLREAA